MLPLYKVVLVNLTWLIKAVAPPNMLMADSAIWFSNERIVRPPNFRFRSLQQRLPLQPLLFQNPYLTSDNVLESQETSLAMVHFVLGKTKLLERLRGALNPRQEKALLRMFAEGLEGFEGGLSSSNYQRITGTSSATATRDLVDLVDKGALVRTGKQRKTRYSLPLEISSGS